ncbi:hypothetical protein DPMN_089027 [Dreissena polymorpha]|uniref:Uncharacterized protein n=1 Tax=Dreissena polymorpha TaxID=45954 RepID=A0A9D4KV65_DREPO|nr:hypothetical protein DPMN_089027 [Dreissena polymorpha]
MKYRKSTNKYCDILVILLLLSVIFTQTGNVNSQITNQNTRPFPPLFNAAQYRPVLTEPSQGTCGVQDRSAYCKSSIFPISISTCTQDFCVQQCPGRSETPSYFDLLTQKTGFSDCVFLDTINKRPGSPFQSASMSFIGSGPTCFVTPTVTPNMTSTQEFTISLWVWPKMNNNG